MLWVIYYPLASRETQIPAAHNFQYLFSFRKTMLSWTAQLVHNRTISIGIFISLPLWPYSHFPIGLLREKGSLWDIEIIHEGTICVWCTFFNISQENKKAWEQLEGKAWLREVKRYLKNIKERKNTPTTHFGNIRIQKMIYAHIDRYRTSLSSNISTSVVFQVFHDIFEIHYISVT